VEGEGIDFLFSTAAPETIPATIPVSKAASAARAAHGRRGFLHSNWMAALLLAASAVTTTANGARFLENFLYGAASDSDCGMDRFVHHVAEPDSGGAA
jgi:hypothetical protein